MSGDVTADNVRGKQAHIKKQQQNAKMEIVQTKLKKKKMTKIAKKIIKRKNEKTKYIKKRKRKVHGPERKTKLNTCNRNQRSFPLTPVFMYIYLKI